MAMNEMTVSSINERAAEEYYRRGQDADPVPGRISALADHTRVEHRQFRSTRPGGLRGDAYGVD